MVYLITGKQNAGKTHYAKSLAKELRAKGKKVRMIDGDAYRAVTGNKDYSDEGRLKNLKGAARMAQRYEKQGIISILSFVAPKQEWREMMQGYWKDSKVIYLPGGKLWKNTIYESPYEGGNKYWRKIKVQLLLAQGLIYRVFIIGCNFLFFLILTKDINAAFKVSLGWNAINILLYYLFHYVWAKRIKLGKE